MRGRPAISLQGAIQWINFMLEREHGKIPAELIAQAFYNQRTLARAKKKLGLISVYENKKWYWRVPDPFHVPGTVVPKDTTKPAPEPEPEEFDPELAFTTEHMLEVTRDMFMNNKPRNEIVSELINSSARWPNKYPYPVDYLESVVAHFIDGTPIKKELNPNDT